MEKIRKILFFVEKFWETRWMERYESILILVEGFIEKNV